MKNIKLIALLVCLTVIVCSFAGCAKTAALSFDAKGGTVAGEQPESYTNNAELALPTAALQYYKFLGWSLNNDGSGTLYTTLPAELELTEEQVEFGMVLYAVWERLSATITYDLAGGAWADEEGPASYLYGETVELPEPERQYFEFDGWYLGETQVEELTESQEGNVALVAKWTQVETQIFFNFGVATDATLPDAEETFSTEDGLDLSKAEYIPEASGMLFSGWYLDAELTQPVTEIAENTTEAVTLYAKWETTPSIGGDNWVGVQ